MPTNKKTPATGAPATGAPATGAPATEQKEATDRAEAPVWTVPASQWVDVPMRGREPYRVHLQAGQKYTIVEKAEFPINALARVIDANFLESIVKGNL